MNEKEIYFNLDKAIGKKRAEVIRAFILVFLQSFFFVLVWIAITFEIVLRSLFSLQVILIVVLLTALNLTLYAWGKSVYDRKKHELYHLKEIAREISSGHVVSMADKPKDLEVTFDPRVLDKKEEE